MRNVERLDTLLFLEILAELPKTGLWTARVSSDRLLRLRREGGHENYSPLTAVHYHLTEQEIMNCFWVPEVTEQFGFPWWEVLEVSYASDACNCSRLYDRRLRNKMSIALGLPEEKLVWG